MANEHYLNVKDPPFHAPCNGVANDGTALTAAGNAAAALPGGATIVLPPGNYRISSSVTFGANVAVVIPDGVRIAVDAGQTLTFSGGLDAMRAPIFTGSGNVAFTTGAPIEGVCPEWFGTSGASFQTACNAAWAARLPITLAHRIYDLPAGGLQIAADHAAIVALPAITRVNSSIPMDLNGPVLRHSGAAGTWAVVVGKSPGTVPSVGWSNGVQIYDVHIRVTTQGAHGVRLWYATDVILSNVAIFGAGPSSGATGISVEGCVDVSMTECDVSQFAFGVSYSRGTTTATFGPRSKSHYNTYGLFGDGSTGQTFVEATHSVIENNDFGVMTAATGFVDFDLDSVWLENNSKYLAHIQTGNAYVRFSRGQHSVYPNAAHLFIANGARVDLIQSAITLNTTPAGKLVEVIGPNSSLIIRGARFISASKLMVQTGAFPSTNNADWTRVRLADMSIVRYDFLQTPVTSSRPMSPMPCADGSGLTEVTMPAAGHVLGVVFQYSANITGGSYSYQVVKNGTLMQGFTEAGVNANIRRSNAEHLAFLFNAGDRLRVDLATVSLFRQAGGGMRCSLIVALGEDGAI